MRIRQDGVLAIDVPMVRVSGVKQHNGAAFADDGSAAELSLRREDGRGDVPLGGTLPSEFAVWIIPGTYSLHYDWSEGASLPRNRHATVRQVRLVVKVLNLVLNVPSVVQDFAFLHNGEPFPAAEFDYGDIALSRPDRVPVRIGSTFLPSPTVRLIPGTYDVHWQHRAGASVPRNEDARFRTGLVVDGSPLVIDVPSVEISGDIRVNGQVPPASEIENGRLSLALPDSPDRADLGATRWAGYQIRVVPGRYDVVYDHLAGASVMPANTGATFVRGWEVAAEPHRMLDIPSGCMKACSSSTESRSPPRRSGAGASTCCRSLAGAARCVWRVRSTALSAGVCCPVATERPTPTRRERRSFPPTRSRPSAR